MGQSSAEVACMASSDTMQLTLITTCLTTCDMWIGLWSGCYGFGTEHSLGMTMPASMIHVSLCSKNLAEQWRYVVVIEGGGLWGGLV